MPDTPDRAALAERLREMLAGVRRTQRAVATMGFSPESLRDEALARSEGQAEALAAAIAALAAPAVPPSVAEAVGRVMSQACCCEDAATFGGEQLLHARHELQADVHRLIAAVRAATIAEAVRAVEELPDHLTAADDPRETFLWRADALAALRALGGQP